MYQGAPVKKRAKKGKDVAAKTKAAASDLPIGRGQEPKDAAKESDVRRHVLLEIFA